MRLYIYSCTWENSRRSVSYLLREKVMTMVISKGSLKVLKKIKPYFYMVLQQFVFAVMYVLAEATLKDGMNQYVLVVYRNIVGAVVISPFAFWFERKQRPRITMVIFLKIMALALLDPVLQQNSFYVGAKLTSASFASALENIIPAITYIMALVLGLETLGIKRRFDQAKVIGTIANVAGAVLMILYKGPILQLPWYSKRKDDRYNSTEGSMGHGAGSSKWIKGTSFIIGSSSFWSAFLILQSNTLESFPAELTLTALICFIGAVMSAVVALVVERGSGRPWIIGWDNRLFVAIYSGITCTGFSYYLQGVVIRERGPVFASAFGPLGIVMTMAIGSFFLSEKISLGMVIGAIIMVAGLYSLLWGSSKDQLSRQKVRDAEEQELPVIITSTVIANSQPKWLPNNALANLSEGQSQDA